SLVLKIGRAKAEARHAAAGQSGRAVVVHAALSRRGLGDAALVLNGPARMIEVLLDMIEIRTAARSNTDCHETRGNETQEMTKFHIALTLQKIRQCPLTTGSREWLHCGERAHDRTLRVLDARGDYSVSLVTRNTSS